MLSPTLRRFVLATLVLVASSALMAATRPAPLAIRNVDPDRLSAGLFAALDSAGVFGGGTSRLHPSAAAPNISKGKPPAVLDARVGANIRLGDDPTALPSTQRGQAEPHIYRSVANPAVLLGTFQEGRFSDAGSLDCGYSVSTDGGLTWTRALIPQLTTTSGGPFNRATDPVAAIGPQGDLYLNTLVSVSGAFDLAAVVVSRSTDNGATWSAPDIVFESQTSQVMPDKEWLAVNDFVGSSTAGRLAVTWTNFTSDASGATTGSNIFISTSDDRASSWTPWAPITPAGSNNQGSQPVFFPDGSLGVVYITFASASTSTQFDIDYKRSVDGGRTFPTTQTTVVPNVTGWDDPDLRNGVFLPSAAVARSTGQLFVTYVGMVGGTPRVLVTRSSDQGATWSTPIVASDNPTGDAVLNPAINVTPDGQTVSVIFIDKRNAADGHNFIDLYGTLSFDGGATWQSNIRLSDMSSDIRYAPATTRGYMVGDYLGLAPALTADEPCVGIWCDTRTGDSDPFTVRFAPLAASNYNSWRIARGVGAGTEDPDHDGTPNVLEYALATNPLAADTGETLVLSHRGNGDINAAIAARTDFAGDLSVSGTSAQDTPVTVQVVAGGSSAPAVAPPAGMAWRTFLVQSPPAGVRLSPSAANYIDALDPSAPNTHASSTERAATNTDARLINVSTRAVVGTGASQMIVGFVLDGTKTMLVRAAGPSLATLGVSNTLAHPQLSLQLNASNPPTTVVNADWEQSTATADLFSRLGAFPFATGSSDAALVQTLGAGNYTAIVSGVNGETGAALAEAYDADPIPGSPAGARITNLSTRAGVGTGDAVMIGGFVISGDQPRRVLIRGVGPTLTQLSVTGVLTDPVLTLYRNGAVVATNDDWQISRSSAAIAATGDRLGAFGLGSGSLDAAIVITLDPGNYTAIVSGVSGMTGVALVEVYDAD